MDGDEMQGVRDRRLLARLSYEISVAVERLGAADVRAAASRQVWAKGDGATIPDEILSSTSAHGDGEVEAAIIIEALELTEAVFGKGALNLVAAELRRKQAALPRNVPIDDDAPTHMGIDPISLQALVAHVRCYAISIQAGLRSNDPGRKQDAARRFRFLGFARTGRGEIGKLERAILSGAGIAMEQKAWQRTRKKTQNDCGPIVGIIGAICEGVDPPVDILKRAVGREHIKETLTHFLELVSKPHTEVLDIIHGGWLLLRPQPVSSD